ncbi:MAG: PEP-CTERM sorting domain-containing protein [Verrucomicrobiae bacterium]|nr:PEP-CTERM sorting domain-containing protein [Verrucomicrobiae bacterium]
MIENFESYIGGQPPPTNRWYVSSGANVPIVTTAFAGDGTKSFISSYAVNPTYYQGVGGVDNDDAYQTISWGPAFKVTNNVGSLSFKLFGGNNGFSTSDRRYSATGVAVWDVSAGDFVPGTFTTRSSSGNDFSESKTINLSSLTVGKTYLPVVLDLHTGGWGKTGLDALTAPDDTVILGSGPHHVVYRAYNFDTVGDFEGWTGSSNFRLAGNGTSSRYIDFTGSYSDTHGFLSSDLGGDGSTGTFVSPTFTLQGDIIEFRISGGKGGATAFKGTGANTASLGFELVNASDNSVLRWAVGQDMNEFTLDYWTVKDLIGTSVYLRVRDDTSGGWGKLHVDAIREVGFFEVQDLAVPEPSVALLLGVGGAVLYRRQRRSTGNG